MIRGHYVDHATVSLVQQVTDWAEAALLWCLVLAILAGAVAMAACAVGLWAQALSDWRKSRLPGHLQ